MWSLICFKHMTVPRARPITLIKRQTHADQFGKKTRIHVKIHAVLKIKLLFIINWKFMKEFNCI